MNSYPRLFDAFNNARTLVDVGIHHLDLLRGGKDLSAGGNCLIVTNCNRFLKMALNLDEGRVLNQWTKSWWSLFGKLVTCCSRCAKIV